MPESVMDFVYARGSMDVQKREYVCLCLRNVEVGAGSEKEAHGMRSTLDRRDRG